VLMPEVSTLAYQGESRRRRAETARSTSQGYCPKGFGLIARTACEGKKEEELAADLGFSATHVESVQEKAKRVRAPQILHHDLGMIFRVIRTCIPEPEKIVVDDVFVFKKIEEFLKEYLPTKVARQSTSMSGKTSSSSTGSR